MCHSYLLNLFNNNFNEELEELKEVTEKLNFNN
jgi:hypothetical protein